MNDPLSDWVRPLSEVENQFLQVLLTQFKLQPKQEKGVRLIVRAKSGTSAIWRRGAVARIRREIAQFDVKAPLIQQRLDDLLLKGNKEPYPFNDAEFRFRYASGGVLPVINLRGKNYFCLFYREIFPVGWNIANGYCDSSDELLHPVKAQEREFREELIIVDSRNRRRYVPPGELGHRHEPPDCALARDLWKLQFDGMGFPPLEDYEMALEWILGPDSIDAEIDERHGHTDNCFLSINTGDFGIEVDNIVKLRLAGDPVFCDGEVLSGGLLDRVVGLFEVEPFTVQLKDGAKEFRPDILYRGGRQYEREDFDEVRQAFLDSPVLKHEPGQPPGAMEKPLDLCPATRHIIERYLYLDAAALSTQPRPSGGASVDIFISFHSQDADLASKVFRHLQGKKGRSVFFSNESLHQADFGHAIDRALDEAKYLVAVVTRPEYLERPYVRFEWWSFYNDILAKRKPEAQLLAFVPQGVELRDLPRAFRINNVFRADPASLEPELKRLDAAVS